MPVITIVVLLVVFFGFVGFMVVMQLQEQARLERLRKVAHLNNQNRLVRRYLDDLPPQYQPKDLRLWLFSRLLANYNELLALQPDESLSRRRALLAEEMENFKESKQKRKAKAINDELVVIELRRLLDSLISYIEQEKRHKNLDQDTAFRYNNIITFFRCKVRADHQAYQARQFFLLGKLEEAIEFYEKAIGELEEVEQIPEAMEAKKRFEGYITELQSDLQLQQDEAAKEAENAEDCSAEEELDDEWAKFFENNEFQKKKHF